MARPDWRTYFLALAGTVSIRSDCERSKVGAVVVIDNRVRGTGYNGAPPGKPGCHSCPRRLSSVLPGSDYRSGPGRCVAVHAEENAMDFTDDDDLVGATLYITREPCHDCLKLIKRKKVSFVVWPDGELNLEEGDQ